MMSCERKETVMNNIRQVEKGNPQKSKKTPSKDQYLWCFLVILNVANKNKLVSFDFGAKTQQFVCDL